MIKKPIKPFLFTGIAIILVCAFLPVATTCFTNASGYFETVDLPGYALLPYYLSTFFVTYITITAFFRRSATAKITMIIFTVIGITMTIYTLKLGETGWENACGRNPTGYQYLLNFGHLLVLVASYIRIFTQKDEQKAESDLLDEF